MDSYPEENPAFDLMLAQGSRHMLAVDVSDFVRRAWHGHVNKNVNKPHLAAPSALQNIARVLRGQQPTHVVFAGEGQGSIRKTIDKTYKANRPPKPDGLALCEARVEQALATAGQPIQRFAGLEADDVLHGAVIVARLAGLPVVVCTRDHDLEQLADYRGVVVWDGAEKVHTEASVLESRGVHPSRLAELFAIAGDDGDNIAHVKGWSHGTARKILVAADKPLPELLKDGGHWWVPAKYRALFIANREIIRRAFDLVKLRGESCATKIILEECRVLPLLIATSLSDSAEYLEKGFGNEGR